MRDNVKHKKMNTATEREHRKCKAIHRFRFYRRNENLNWNSFDFLVVFYIILLPLERVAWCCFKCCCCWILIPWKCLFSDNVTRSEQRAMAQTQFSSEKRATKTRIYHTFGYCTQHMCLCVVKSMFNHTHTNTRDPAAEIVTTFFLKKKLDKSRRIFTKTGSKWKEKEIQREKNK